MTSTRRAAALRARGFAAFFRALVFPEEFRRPRAIVRSFAVIACAAAPQAARLLLNPKHSRAVPVPIGSCAVS
ncbi:MAG: hypothetical protein ACKVOI_19130 [Dongiaceae bacterium]